MPLKLTEEEEKQIIADAKKHSKKEHKIELPYGIEDDLDAFIEELQDVRLQIQEKQPLQDSTYVAFEEVPNTWDDYTHEQVFVYYTTIGDKEAYIRDQRHRRLKEKERRYQEYLRLKEEFDNGQ